MKVIRLLGRDTVEEMIFSRAVSKLRLTNTVIEEGQFSLLEKSKAASQLEVRLSPPVPLHSSCLAHFTPNLPPCWSAVIRHPYRP